MDPQHRIFLEVALGGARARRPRRRDAFTGQVGVFAGCGMNSYLMYQPADEPAHHAVGRRVAGAAHRQRQETSSPRASSYHLDLKGPSMNVQTRLLDRRSSPSTSRARACSAASATWRSPAASTIDAAAGPRLPVPERARSCRPTATAARSTPTRTGTLFGSGAGVVVLRRLADALADGDTILAVIKGSAVNNDGSRKVGYLAPSVEGQARVIAEALAVAGVDADTCRYVEAHGTGTPSAIRSKSPALTHAFRAPHRSRRLLRHRLAQDEHRPSRRRRRRRRPSSRRCWPAASAAAADAELRDAEPADRLRDHPVRRQRPAARRGCTRRAAPRRHHRARRRRHELPRDSRRGARPRRRRRPRRARAAAGAVGENRDGARGRRATNLALTLEQPRRARRWPTRLHAAGRARGVRASLERRRAPIARAPSARCAAAAARDRREQARTAAPGRVPVPWRRRAVSQHGTRPLRARARVPRRSRSLPDVPPRALRHRSAPGARFRIPRRWMTRPRRCRARPIRSSPSSSSSTRSASSGCRGASPRRRCRDTRSANTPPPAWPVCSRWKTRSRSSRRAATCSNAFPRGRCSACCCRKPTSPRG